MPDTFYPELVKLLESGHRITVTNQDGDAVTVKENTIKVLTADTVRAFEPKEGLNAAQHFIQTVNNFTNIRHLHAHITGGQSEHCPYCGSADVLCEDLPDYTEHSISESITCTDCKRTYTTTYLRTGLVLDDGTTYPVVTPVNQRYKNNKENA